MNRRYFLTTAVAAAAQAQTTPLRAADKDIEIQISPVSAYTFRLTVLPVESGKAAAVPMDGSLVQPAWGKPIATMRGNTSPQTIRHGNLRIQFTPQPLEFAIQNAGGETVQRLRVDAATGNLTFQAGATPLLGLGQGGPQFDRRGSVDRMRSGQVGYQLRTHGGRLPIPWMIGTSGWAMFIHQPYGSFDFSGAESKLLPTGASLPLDIFFVVSKDPAIVMTEYTKLTGRPELPALWTFGYQQSHRTLASRESILKEADTFREKKLPCDAMIYLGTGFCPSGWNTNNGEWQFNSKVFPDPKQIFDEFHDKGFKVVLHAVVKARRMSGTVKDACDASRPAEEQPSCYWDIHRPIFKLGVDGWWPDEGDPFDTPSRLTRNRMYWEGPQLDRPNERPYALHRNGYAGMQRYGTFLWSGDVYSTWETLKVHVPVAVNTGLTGIPFWGTDIGGFVPTSELSAELYLRWFQFAAFCPLFRAHGRNWTLRLPWGWNTGDLGPMEIAGYTGAAVPSLAELHNAAVEPICRKYLELRYRLMPYLYSAARESTTTGMPILRAMWLHYPEDAGAVARGDQYLWGRDMLVAPVVEKGATERKLYLPRGAWHDFWTGERLEGGREISRKVDLETTPLYVRAGAILPFGPVKQYTAEKVDAPLEVRVYPGAAGSFLLYEDDGKSFDYRKGEWMGLQMAWNDERKTLSMRLANGSKMLPPASRPIQVKVGDVTKSVSFTGRPTDVRF